jgi:sulfoacetaldehyde dehydrogenase
MTAEAKVSIERLIARARAAQEPFILADQSSVDEAVCALAWSVYKSEHARELAELAVADKGLGNVPDKIVEKQRKTLGTLRDLLRVKSVGIIEEMPALGIVKYAKPVGVVGAVTPSTNPAATPVNKAMMAVKGRNAIVIAPSPLSYRTSARTVELMRAELEKIGAPQDLVQILSEPVTKDLTQALMEAVDLVVVTGSQDNVRRAYASGTPAIGVGVGNVPVIIDETADLASAAAKVCASKSFDDATSCSSENAIVILDETYEAAMAALQADTGVAPRKSSALSNCFGAMASSNRDLIARDAAVR